MWGFLSLGRGDIDQWIAHLQVTTNRILKQTELVDVIKVI